MLTESRLMYVELPGFVGIMNWNSYSSTVGGQSSSDIKDIYIYIIHTLLYV